MDVAKAAWTQYQRSPSDTFNRSDLTPQYDLQEIHFAISDADPSKYNFFLWFSQPVTANMFADGQGSWAGVMIDLNKDGKDDWSLETNANIPYSGNVSHAAYLVDRSSNSATITNKCNVDTWTNLDTSVTWIGFAINKSCIDFGQTFNLQGYSDHISGDNKDFDSAPTDYWQLNVNGDSISTTKPSINNSNLPTLESDSSISISSPANPPNDLVDLASKISKSVVTILCGNGLGSGWAAKVSLTSNMSASGYQTYLITNQHVISDCTGSRSVTVVLSDQSKIPGYVWAWDSTNDVAGVLIKVQMPTLNFKGVPPQQGWWAGVMGSPLGFPGMLTTGIISSVNTATSLSTTTAPINPGNSGGPVFDRNGRVIGLATAKMVNSEGFGILHGTPMLCGKVLVCNADQLWGISSTTNGNSSNGNNNQSVSNSSKQAVIDAETAYLKLETKCLATIKLFSKTAAGYLTDSNLYKNCTNRSIDVKVQGDLIRNSTSVTNSTVTNAVNFINAASDFLEGIITDIEDSVDNFESLVSRALDLQEIFNQYDAQYKSLNQKLLKLPKSDYSKIINSQEYLLLQDLLNSLEDTNNSASQLLYESMIFESASDVSTASISIDAIDFKPMDTKYFKSTLLKINKIIPKYVCTKSNFIMKVSAAGACPIGYKKVLVK